MNGWPPRAGDWDEEPAWTYEITWEWEPLPGQRYPGDPGQRRGVARPADAAGRRWDADFPPSRAAVPGIPPPDPTRDLRSSWERASVNGEHDPRTGSPPRPGRDEPSWNRPVHLPERLPDGRPGRRGDIPEQPARPRPYGDPAVTDARGSRRPYADPAGADPRYAGPRRPADEPRGRSFPDDPRPPRGYADDPRRPSAPPPRGYADDPRPTAARPTSPSYGGPDDPRPASPPWAQSDARSAPGRSRAYGDPAAPHRGRADEQAPPRRTDEQPPPRRARGGYPPASTPPASTPPPRRPYADPAVTDPRYLRPEAARPSPVSPPGPDETMPLPGGRDRRPAARDVPPSRGPRPDDRPGSPGRPLQPDEILPPARRARPEDTLPPVPRAYRPDESLPAPSRAVRPDQSGSGGRALQPDEILPPAGRRARRDDYPPPAARTARPDDTLPGARTPRPDETPAAARATRPEDTLPPGPTRSDDALAAARATRPEDTLPPVPARPDDTPAPWDFDGGPARAPRLDDTLPNLARAEAPRVDESLPAPPPRFDPSRREPDAAPAWTGPADRPDLPAAPVTPAARSAGPPPLDVVPPTAAAAAASAAPLAPPAERVPETPPAHEPEPETSPPAMDVPADAEPPGDEEGGTEENGDEESPAAGWFEKVLVIAGPEPASSAEPAPTTEPEPALFTEPAAASSTVEVEEPAPADSDGSLLELLLDFGHDRADDDPTRRIVVPESPDEGDTDDLSSSAARATAAAPETPTEAEPETEEVDEEDEPVHGTAADEPDDWSPPTPDAEEPEAAAGPEPEAVEAAPPAEVTERAEAAAEDEPEPTEPAPDAAAEEEANPDGLGHLLELSGLGATMDEQEAPAEDPVPERPAAPAADWFAAHTDAELAVPVAADDQNRLVDPEQVLSSYAWRFDPETLREVADDLDQLRAVRDRLTDKLEYAERDAVRARLLSLRAVVSRVLGDLDRALADGRDALAHAEATGELRRRSIAGARLAHVRQWRGEYPAADRLYEEANSAELPERLRAEIHELAGRSAFEQGRLLEAVNHFEHALNLRRRGDDGMVARIETALDAVQRRAADGDWGPYPRSRDEILQRHRPPEPTFDEEADRWGYADAVPPAFAAAEPFHEGSAWVKRPGAEAWELIDEQGATVIDAAAGYLAAGPFAEGLAWVSRDPEGGWFAIDRRNRVVLSGGYDEVRPFHRGLAPVRRGGWGAVDRHGRLMVQPKYRAFVTVLSDGRRLDSFTEDGLAVVDAGDRKGVVNAAGELVVPPVHADLLIHPVAFLIADRAGRWGALDRRGGQILEVTRRSAADVADEIDRLLADTRPVL